MIRFQSAVFRDVPNIIYKKFGRELAIFHEIQGAYLTDTYGKIL